MQGLLLDAAADLVHHLGARLDDVERVENRDRVSEAVAQGVGVAGNGSREACLTRARNVGVWASSHVL